MERVTLQPLGKALKNRIRNKVPNGTVRVPIELGPPGKGPPTLNTVAARLLKRDTRSTAGVALKVTTIAAINGLIVIVQGLLRPGYSVTVGMECLPVPCSMV